VRSAFRVFGVLFLAVMLVAAYGFFTSDDAAVEANARSIACAGRGPKCHAALERYLKTPFFQDRRFRVGGATVDVRCTRTRYLIGEHRCAVSAGSSN
jgi:hypothetical protein